ncbi:MAG: hypothetical protein ACI3YM_01840 [Prevotella sp.]
MKKTFRMLGALLVVCLMVGALASCCDDDDATDYGRYVAGTWDAESVSVLDYEPNGEYYFTYTFKTDGTGYTVRKADGSIGEWFSYELLPIDAESGGAVDFILRFTVTDELGKVKYEDVLGGKKKGKDLWHLTDAVGVRTLYVMHRK